MKVTLRAVEIFLGSDSTPFFCSFWSFLSAHSSLFWARLQGEIIPICTYTWYGGTRVVAQKDKWVSDWLGKWHLILCML